MNGKDGKPFKTREGGVMRLENLITDIDEEMFTKIVENRSVKIKMQRNCRDCRSFAIKYGDLSNQATKDYILILTDLHHLKEIQVRISFIRSFVSNPFLNRYVQKRAATLKQVTILAGI